MKKLRKKERRTMKSDNRAIVGYVQSAISSKTACDVQRAMINNYCREKGVECSRFFCDVDHFENRHKSSVEKAKKIGIRSDRWLGEYPELENLMVEILDNKIGTILVDTRLRLFCDTEHRTKILQLIKDGGIEIIEVGNEYIPRYYSNLLKDGAICVYHFTKSIFLSTVGIDQMYWYISTWLPNRNQVSINLYLDHSECGRTEFNKLLKRDDVGTIVAKDMYHIKRKIGPFIQVLKKLQSNNIRLITIKDGEIYLQDDKIHKQENSRVIIYENLCSSYEETNKELLVEKLKLYCKQNGWDITKIIIETGGKRNRYKSITEITPEIADFILVSSYTKLVDEVSELKVLLQECSLPIYSIKEGRIIIDEIK